MFLKTGYVYAVQQPIWTPSFVSVTFGRRYLKHFLAFLYSAANLACISLTRQEINKEEEICLYNVRQFLTQLSMSYLDGTSADTNWQLINLSFLHKPNCLMRTSHKPPITTRSAFLSWGKVSFKYPWCGRE